MEERYETKSSMTEPYPILEWAVYIIELQTAINVWRVTDSLGTHSFAAGSLLQAIPYGDRWVVAAGFLVDREPRHVKPIQRLREMGRLPESLRWRTYHTGDSLDPAYRWLTDPLVRLSYALANDQ